MDLHRTAGYRTAARLLAVGLACALLGCRASEAESAWGDEAALRVVATTTQVADLARVIGGERVAVRGLMGAGVDPHLYRPRASDVKALAQADVIFYNGLHLEGKMADVLSRLEDRAVAVAEALPPGRLIEAEGFSGAHDPHFWFDVGNWKLAARVVQERLAALDPAGAEVYAANTAAYTKELDDLDAYLRRRVAEVPPEQRVMVTAHDAFGYFGRVYGFEVRGLQGISTATEAGTRDVDELAKYIASRRIRAVFVETSVSERRLQAVQDAVAALGWQVGIGGSLYSDAMGDSGTPEGTYLGMMRHNIDTLVDSLTQD